MHKDDCLLYESGELGPDEAAAFESHLPGCAECRDWLETVRAGRRWAAAASVEPPSPGPAPAPPLAVLPRGASARALGAACAALVAALLIARRPPARAPRETGASLEWDSSGLHDAILRARDGIGTARRTLDATAAPFGD